jgi:hypothetical protein
MDDSQSNSNPACVSLSLRFVSYRKYLLVSLCVCCREKPLDTHAHHFDSRSRRIQPFPSGSYVFQSTLPMRVSRKFQNAREGASMSSSSAPKAATRNSDEPFVPKNNCNSGYMFCLEVEHSWLTPHTISFSLKSRLNGDTRQ